MRLFNIYKRNNFLKLLFAGWFCLVITFLSAQNNSLILNGGYVVLKGNTISTPVYFIINQSNASGIIRPGGGHIHSENQYSFIKWNTGNGTGNYVFPFGVNGISANYIPFTFNKTTSENSDITVSTWATNIQNLPHPGISNVAEVCCMTCAADSVKSAIDRFWDIRSSGNTTANLTFSYLGSENTTVSPSGIFMTQHWNGAQWDPQTGLGNIGVTTGIGTVGPVIGQTTFSPRVLTKSPSDVMATANLSSICNGASSTLTATGANTYSWLPSNSLNSGTGSSVTASPTATTTYTLTGTDENGCIDTATVTVIVKPLPVVTANATATNVCAGTSVTLTGSGAISYVWTGGVTDGTAFVPSSTTTYTVTGTNGNNCSNTATKTITVNPLPVVDAGLDQIVYYGYPPSQCATLAGSATGGITYSWSPGGATTLNTSVCPTTTTTYTLTVTDANGCTNTDNVTVNVIDVRCSKNKVKVCHDKKTICIAIADVAAHLAHGDYLGVCTSRFAIDMDSSVVGEEKPLTVYPNPTTGLFSFEVCKNNVAEEVKIEVRNSIGQIVYSKTPFKTEGCVKEVIELDSELPNGIYFLNLIIGDKVQTAKIILAK